MKEWEIARDSITDLKELGEGNFGLVYLATARNLIPGEAETKVAVKTLTSQTAAAEKDFMQEAGGSSSRGGPSLFVAWLIRLA